MISLIVLAIVFILIAIRRIGSMRLQVWQIMLLGAFTVLVTGQISLPKALKAINLDVMLFLFCMFIVGEALDVSGYLRHLAHVIFSRIRSLNLLVLAVLFFIGLMSAFLMNDTMAIIGTPLVLLLAKKANATPKVMMLSLAFAITIGSAISPIGNPQNLLIAISGGINNPFITFFQYLLLPTLVNLIIAYALLRFFYRHEFHHQAVSPPPESIIDPALARLSRISLVLLLVLVILKIVLALAGSTAEFHLNYIALVSALPLVLFSPKRFVVLRNIDWCTLIFFAAMFVLMESVWDSGIFQDWINNTHMQLNSVPVIMAVSIVLSQFISNVPLVALYLPILTNLGMTTKQLMTLAAGSTIAGNLTILGAASNVIIIQNAEKKAGETLTFWEFIRIGAPLTALNAMVYWVFFQIL